MVLLKKLPCVLPQECFVFLDAELAIGALLAHYD